MRITKLLLTIIATCAVLVSCDKSSSDKLAGAIPANAIYVMNINSKTIAEKSAYDVFDNVATKRGVSVAQAMLSTKEAMDMLDAFTKDVNSIGVNLKGDCYFYTDYSMFGLVMEVNNAEKIKEAFVNFARIDAETIQKDEKGIYSFAPDKNAVLCWDKDKLLVLGNIDRYRYYYGDDKDKAPDLVAMAKKQLTQKSEESILSNSSFGTFLKDKKDISIFYSYANFDFLEKMSGMKLPEEIKNELNDLKGISSLAYISFEKGEVKANSKICYANSDVEKKYKELTDQLTGDLKGDQLKYIQENPLFFVSANLKGSGIYNYLEKLKLAPKMEKEFAHADAGVDLKTIFGYFEGDITFSVRDIESVKKSHSWGNGETYEYDSTEPMLAVMANVKNGKDLLNLIVKQMNEENAVKTDDNNYVLEQNGLSNYFGLKGDIFYYTNDKVFFDNMQSGDLKNTYGALTKNNAVVMGGSINNVKQMILDEVRDERIQPLVNEGINLLGAYSFTTSKELTGEGKLIINDNSKNSLAVICQYIDKVLTTVNDEIKF